ncbi:ankyrin repeat-containing domain protein [Geopyxis carbonaria]|nr:ankyrin repeat-containing domain protein [Geopyxis carbonaria]
MNIPPEMWDQHYGELKEMYHAKTLPQIKLHMETNHGFQASDNQYASAFKKWGWRKNFKESEWKWVHQQILKRKRDTVVYDNDMMVPPEKVRREMYRRFPPSFKPASSPVATPPRITVRTPDPETPLASMQILAVEEETPQSPYYLHNSSSLLPLNDNTIPILPRSIGESNPSSWRLEISDNIEISQPYVPLSPLPQDDRKIPTLSTSPQKNLFENYQKEIQSWSPARLERLGNLDLSPTKVFPYGDIIGDLWVVQAPNNVEINLGNLPFHYFEDVLKVFAATKHYQDWVAKLFNIKQTPLLEGHCLLLGKSEGDTSNLVNGLIPSLVTKKKEGKQILAAVYAHLQATYLEKYDDELLSDVKTLLGPVGNSTHQFCVFLKYLVQLASNNTLTCVQIDRFLECVTPKELIVAMSQFFSTHLQTIEVFSRMLLSRALKNCKSELVEFLLCTGIDPNQPLPRLEHGLFEYLLPLYRAVDSQDILSAKHLLAAGADPNICYDQPPLFWAIRKNDIEMARLLLDHNAKIEPAENFLNSLYWPSLQGAVLSENLALTKILLERGANVNAPAANYDDKNKSCTTLLQMISCKSSIPEDKICSIASLLLDNGAEINAPAKFCSFNFDKHLLADEESGFTALQAAVSSKNQKLVAMIIDAGADIHAPPSILPDGKMGRNLLHRAVAAGNYQMVCSLVSRGADVNELDESSCRVHVAYNCKTALQEAVAQGKPSIIKLLLESGAKVHMPGWSLFSIAALVDGCNQKQIVKALVEAKVDINVYDEGDPPLVAASSQGNMDLVKFYLDLGANIDFKSIEGTALWMATNRKDAKLVWFLLKSGADVNISSSGRSSPLEKAISMRNPEIISLLLDNGADVDENRAILEKAVFFGDLDIVRMLLERNVKINHFQRKSSKTRTINPLSWAALNGDASMVRTLLSAGADVNGICEFVIRELYSSLRRDNKFSTTPSLFLGEDFRLSLSSEVGSLLGDIPTCATALSVAANRGNTEFFEIILEAGADVNGTIGQSWTPLQAAVEHGNMRIIRRLLESGADIDAPACPTGGRTALQMAAVKGNSQLVKILLDKGAKVNAPAARMQGVTALQGAAIFGYLNIVAMLLQHGADPNGKRAIKEGRTALEGAAEHGRLDVLQLLLNSGACKHHSQADKAKAHAWENGHCVIFEILERHADKLRDIETQEDYPRHYSTKPTLLPIQPQPRHSWSWRPSCWRPPCLPRLMYWNLGHYYSPGGNGKMRAWPRH